MKSETRSIDGPYDFELSRERSRPLSYTVSTPDEGAAKGLVFVIPGFGADTAKGYGEALRRHICDEHGLAAVSVDYHCIQSRPENGGALSVSTRDHLMLLGVAALNGLKIDNNGDLMELTTKLAAVSGPVEAYAEIAPGGGEYQNFGVLQAMDHLTALADIVAKGPVFDRSQVIAFGSSHGGYIAHMMAKIAPSTLSLVIDNSSYTQPPMSYMGMATDGEYRARFAGVSLVCRVKNGWTLDDRDLPNFYSRDADLIRDLAYPPHLAAMRQAASGQGPRFAMVNAAEDSISPPKAKRRQAALMSAVGIDCSLDVIDQPQIDGVVFKAMVHGLDVSLKGLFDRMAPLARPRSGKLDCELDSGINYACVDKGYRFKHSSAGVTGETYELYPIRDDGSDQVAA